MADGLAADMRQIGRELKEVDRKFASAVRKQIRAAVTEAGAGIAGEVRSSASWSSRIPGAVYVRPNFSERSAGVRVVVSRAKAPEARVLEMGNVGGSESATTFRHPVFQRLTGTRLKRAARGTSKRWVTQKKRPFFFVAVSKMTLELEAKFQAAVGGAVRDAGFR